MFADEIYKITDKLKKQCKSTDPFEIADMLGIMVMLRDDFKKLCGLYTVIKRKRVIILNGNLSENRLKIVLAHEIGHDILHRDMAVNTALQEFMLYDMSARPEYEANMFAADLLLDDDEIYELVSVYRYDMEQIASKLCTDINLVGIKIGSMNYRGYKLTPGLPVKNNFLQD
ncbi:MAG: ImmA/IrrE family metallo-endopeptidase [Clostridiales bacterium]|nr:ImmA/IrrE family metallo-endopeptidase [Clostridiales bacterium]